MTNNISYEITYIFIYKENDNTYSLTTNWYSCSVFVCDNLITTLRLATIWSTLLFFKNLQIYYIFCIQHIMIITVA